MVRLAVFIFALLLIVLSLPSCKQKETPGPAPAAYVELGIPSAADYETGVRARSPWDMIVYDGALYVGNGDFDANAGPVRLYRYDPLNDEWTSSAELPEEEINRFCLLDGRLTTPGIDPKEDWDLGNYYVLQNGEWVQNRVLPDGIHAFDLAEYDGKIFAGLGVPAGKYPVAVSKDGGLTFQQVEMETDGEPTDTTGHDWVRVYDLFTLKGDLYALYLYGSVMPLNVDLYKYEDGRFVFFDCWTDKIKFRSISYSPVCARAEYRNRVYLTTGTLYVTDDMMTLTPISFPNSETVFDLVQENGTLYALCGQRLDENNVRVSVWRKEAGNVSGFYELFWFEYPIAPLSLAVDGETFYIGTSDTAAENESNGTILKVEHTK